MPGHKLTAPIPATAVLDPPEAVLEKDTSRPSSQAAGPDDDQTMPEQQWSPYDRELHMARLIEAASRDLALKMSRLPELGDFELTDTQLRVLFSAIQESGLVWAHKIYQRLITEGDEPSGEAVRKSLERLAALGLLIRSPHPVPSPDGAARWTYEVVRPDAEIALERERNRRLQLVQSLQLVQKVDSRSEEVRHLTANATTYNPDLDSATMRSPQRSGAG